MKAKILALTLTSAMVAASLITFAQEDKKAKEARKDLSEANKDLKEAKTDSAADYQKFKAASETKIRDNQMQIANLKAKKSTDTKEVKESYDKRVVTLEQKNNDLKMKINGSSKVKSSEWSSFKRDFNQDMDELGQAIKDIGTDGTK
jgi:FtsZ-binding cell division protein ZapB